MGNVHYKMTFVLAEACYRGFIVKETTHTFIVHAITNVKYVYCEVNPNDDIMNAAEPEYLTLKRRETHGCVVSTVATDALVLKHQAISILSTD